MKRLSIITIVLNQRAGIQKTARSVKKVRPDWCEWIVIGGNSTDGTKDFLDTLGGQPDWII